MNILDIRNQYNLSQKEAASIINMPLRTFVRYEKDNRYDNETKRQSIIRTLIEKNEITETKGLLTIDQIKESLTKLFDIMNKC